MVDFNTPILTTDKDSVLSQLSDRINAVGSGDYTGDTNLPTGILRWNQSSNSGDWERWNGSSWDVQKPATLATSSVTTDSVSADAITSAETLLANNTYLRIQDSFGNTRNAFGLNASNEAVINAYGGAGLRVNVNDTTYFTLGNNAILPQQSGNLGSAAATFGAGHVGTLNVSTVTGTNGVNEDLVLDGGAAVYLSIAESSKLLLTSASLSPLVTNDYDLGTESLIYNQVFTSAISPGASEGLIIDCPNASKVISMFHSGTMRSYLDSTGWHPNGSGVYDLGKSSAKWNFGHFDNIGASGSVVGNIWASVLRNNNLLEITTSDILRLKSHDAICFSGTRQEYNGVTDNCWYVDGSFAQISSQTGVTLNAGQGNGIPIHFLRISVSGTRYFIPMFAHS